MIGWLGDKGELGVGKAFLLNTFYGGHITNSDITTKKNKGKKLRSVHAYT